jgi:hypothetical protein
MENESFQQAKTLLHQAQFDKALQIVNTLGEKEDLSPEDNLTHQILKSRILAGKGEPQFIYIKGSYNWPLITFTTV